MSHPQLQVKVRHERGKGAAHRLRAQGEIPGVFYGPGIEPVAVSVDPRALEKVLETDRGRNTIIELVFDDGRASQPVICKDFQSEPVTYRLLHVDFYQVSEERTITIKVPFQTKGRALGVQKGGTLHVTRRDVPVRCTPSRIPAVIELDVTSLDLGGVMRVKDLQLPEGVEVLLDGQIPLANVGGRVKVEPQPGAEA